MRYQYTNIRILTVILLAGFTFLNFVPIIRGQEPPIPMPASGKCPSDHPQEITLDFGGGPTKYCAKGDVQQQIQQKADEQKRVEEEFKKQGIALPLKGDLIPPSPSGSCPSGYNPTDAIVADGSKTAACLKSDAKVYTLKPEERRYSANLLPDGGCPGGHRKIIVIDEAFKQVCLRNDIQPQELIGSRSARGIGIDAYKTIIDIPCSPVLGTKAECPSTATPAGYIARLYQFGLMIAGLVAFGAIVFGSIKYILSAGNPANQKDAREQITQAIFGVVLLLGAYLILYTINPDLVNLRNPRAEIIDIETILREQQKPVERQDGTPTNQEVLGGDTGFCKTALNATVNVRGPKEVIGESEKSGWICLQCMEGHTTEGSLGTDPKCPYCITGYTLSGDGKRCVKSR